MSGETGRDSRIRQETPFGLAGGSAWRDDGKNSFLFTMRWKDRTMKTNRNILLISSLSAFAVGVTASTIYVLAGGPLPHSGTEHASAASRRLRH